MSSAIDGIPVASITASAFNFAFPINVSSCSSMSGISGRGSKTISSPVDSSLMIACISATLWAFADAVTSVINAVSAARART